MAKMMKKLLFLFVGLVCAATVSAQGFRDVKINEILVKNVDSYADDYGHKVGWIELYNSGFSSVNVAGMHLRFVQGSDTITYKIPKNDIRTQMAPQGYLVFFADGSSNKGTFYTNFELDVTDSARLEELVALDDKIELLDQSGRNVVDAIQYDVNTQVPDVSYGRLKNYETGEYSYQLLSHLTPLQGNETIEPKAKGEVFREQDPAGVAMAITAMSVVFMALILLYLIFRTIGKAMHSRQTAKREATAAALQPTNATEAASVATAGDASGEVIAAIAAALRFYEDDMHDLESEIITINRVARVYSPWSSKIYTLRQLPNRK